MVTFYPIDTTIGPAASGSFENGAYRFTTDDGPVPGEYNVSIEFEESESSPPKARNGPGAGLISKSETGIGEARLQIEPEKITAASVPADGPFEIDLNPTESAPE
jgi:hypothetical protein